MIRLELVAGPFLAPALVRALRAVGVQAGIDLARLDAASAAAEAAAGHWADGSPDDVLLVEIGQGDALTVVFALAARDLADGARDAALAAAGGAPGLRAEVARAADDTGAWRLEVSVG